MLARVTRLFPLCAVLISLAAYLAGYWAGRPAKGSSKLEHFATMDAERG